MSTPDMAAWLMERIAEDERVAREAASDRPGPWVQGDHDAPGWDRDLVYHQSDWSGWTQFDYESMASHVARHDPARVLAECEAKRRVVQLCRDAPELDSWVTTALAEEILLHLVQVHSGRPDFQPEWLPEVPW